MLQAPRRPVRAVAMLLAQSAIGVCTLVGCTSGTAPTSGSGTAAATQKAPRGPALLDTSTPAAFITALQGGLKGMGHCAVRQQVDGEQFGSQARISLGEPLAAKIDLAPSVSADRPVLTTVVMLQGKSYVHQGGPDDLWRVVADQPVSSLVGEMDCRSVLESLKMASVGVKAGGGGSVKGRPAQTYHVEYDTRAWASAVGDLGKPDAATASLVVAVIDSRLAQLQLMTPQARTTEYLWFPGAPDVVAPPADLIAK